MMNSERCRCPPPPNPEHRLSAFETKNRPRIRSVGGSLALRVSREAPRDGRRALRAVNHGVCRRRGTIGACGTPSTSLTKGPRSTSRSTEPGTTGAAQMEARTRRILVGAEPELAPVKGACHGAQRRAERLVLHPNRQNRSRSIYVGGSVCWKASPRKWGCPRRPHSKRKRRSPRAVTRAVVRHTAPMHGSWCGTHSTPSDAPNRPQ